MVSVTVVSGMGKICDGMIFESGSVWIQLQLDSIIWLALESHPAIRYCFGPLKELPRSTEVVPSIQTIQATTETVTGKRLVKRKLSSLFTNVRPTFGRIADPIADTYDRVKNMKTASEIGHVRPSTRRKALSSSDETESPVEDAQAIVTRPITDFLRPNADARLIISSPHSTFRSPRVSQSYGNLRTTWETVEEDDNIELPSTSGLRSRDSIRRMMRYAQGPSGTRRQRVKEVCT